MRTLVFLTTLLTFVPSPTRARPAAGNLGMVATAHPDATAAGVEILRAGGNAADAIVAAAFALAVVEQHSSGIGGGGFALVRNTDGLSFLDFREVAPRAAKRDMYSTEEGTADPKLSRDGILSVAVPGAVAGYCQLHARYGKLSRAAVMAPAIRLAEDGFRVSDRFRNFIDRRHELLRRDPEAVRILMVDGPDGPVPPPLGQLFRQKDLAKTLRAIRDQGAEVFYRGTVARALAADMKNRGGIITLEDLKSYRVRQRPPLVGSYRGLAVASAPPPSSGGQILLTILGVMETLPVTTPWRSPDWLHRYIEASKHAFADRVLLGDPDFVPSVPVLLPALVAKTRTRALAEGIGSKAKAPHEVSPGQGAVLPAGAGMGKGVRSHRLETPKVVEGDQTAHLCAVDRDGNAVSMTTTVNYVWGSGIFARGTGVLWNDEMDDFAVAPGVANAYGIVGSEANAVAPGKVPLSSMSPTLVFSGPKTTDPVLLVIGSPGGSRIPTTVAQAISHHLDYGADIQTALSIGRVHHQHLPDQVFVEAFGLEPATIEALLRRGHEINVGGHWSNATAISIDPKTGVRTGAADPRGLGTAAAQ